MASSTPFIGTKDAYCTIKAVSTGDSYLKCNVRRSSASFIQPPPISGSRPPICELPGAIREHQEDRGLSPLGECAYRYSAMSRCGCPTLDPEKNPDLWKKYVDSVTNVVLQAVRRQPEEITLTFFASGYLLQDCELLDCIFNLDELQIWKGNLNLQFVDLNYEIDKVQLLKSQLNTFDKKEKVDIGMLMAAIACGGVGIGAIYAGSKQEKKEHKYSCIGVGAVLILVAVILGVQAAPKEREEKKIQESRSVSQIKMQKSAETAVEDFLNQIAVRLPEEISLQTSFFPNAGACIEQGRATDAILGYDIDNSLLYFESLRKSKLKPSGDAIVVIKKEVTKGKNAPVFLAARGPEPDLQPQKI